MLTVCDDLESVGPWRILWGGERPCGVPILVCHLRARPLLKQRWHSVRARPHVAGEASDWRDSIRRQRSDDDRKLLTGIQAFCTRNALESET